MKFTMIIQKMSSLDNWSGKIEICFGKIIRLMVNIKRSRKIKIKSFYRNNYKWSTDMMNCLGKSNGKATEKLP